MDAEDGLPSPFNEDEAFLLSIGDTVRGLGRLILGELRRATAVAMTGVESAMTQRGDARLLSEMECRNRRLNPVDTRSESLALFQSDQLEIRRLEKLILLNG